MTEYSRMAKGTYTQTVGTLGSVAPAAQIINLPFKPDYVELINLTQAITPAQHGIPFAFWDATSQVTISSVTYNPTIVQIFNATPVLTTDSVLTNGISAFSGGLINQFGPVLNISGITKATSAVVTTTGNHNLTSGMVVVFQGLFQSSTTGMPQINGIPFTVTVTGATTFSIPWNTNQSNYTALSGSPSTATVQQVLYPYLYFPGATCISAIATGATTTITTTSAHNFREGQEIAFRIPSLWGTTQLNSLPNTIIPGSPIYGYVISVTNYNTFVVNINSTSYTAFNSNPTFAQAVGLSFAQVVAIGDLNTGGPTYSGTQLYPSLFFEPIGSVQTNTINGPGIRGAFANNTSQGFIVGAGASKTDTTSYVGGSTNDVIEYRAYLHDLSNP